MATCSKEGLDALLQRLGVDSPVPSYVGADVLHSPQDIFHVYLAERLRALVGCEASVAYDAVDALNSTDMGDLVVVSPRLRVKDINAKDLVIDLASKLPQSLPFRASCPLTDGIHLRVFSASDILPRLLLPYIHDRGVAYGYDDSLGLVDRSSGGPTGERKKVIVEFSSPNMAMEFQTSHLRSTLIGASIANLYERQGWQVVRMNYLGDWGKHIGLLACGYQRFGSEDAFEKDPMHHLADVYHQIGELFKPEQEASKAAKNENKDAAEVESQGIYAERDAFFKKMEDGDADAMALWQRFRDATVNYYQHAYARLGIRFDEYSGESQVSQESVSAVETALRDKGVCEESEGSWIINFAKHDAKGLGVAMMRYRNGTTSYLLRDVAAVLDREATFSFDKMIYVVAMEQDNHFGRVIKTLQLMGNEELALKLQHVNFARVTSVPDQLKSAHLLTDYLAGCQAIMQEHMPVEGTAEETEEGPAETNGVSDDAEDDELFVPMTEDAINGLALSSLIIQDLGRKKSSSYNLDAKHMTSFDGEAGPAFQNCYCRLLTALRQGGLTTSSDDDYSALDCSPLEARRYGDVLRVMSQYPAAVAAMYRNLDPSSVTAFVSRLVEQLTFALDDDAEDDQGDGGALPARMALYENARQVLENALRLLGVAPLSLE